jgi:hypothetical protein
MRRPMIPGFAAVVLLAAATTMLRSHSPSTNRPVATADMISSQAATGVTGSPPRSNEDMSLV